MTRPCCVFWESHDETLLCTFEVPDETRLCTFGDPGEIRICTFGGHNEDHVLHFWRPFAQLCGSMRCFQLEWSVSGTKAENSGGSRSPCSLLTLHRLLKPITLAGEYHDVGVMHQAVYQSRCQAVIAQHRIPTGEL